MDLPGTGYSDRQVRRSISFCGLANIVYQATRRLGLESPVLLGHSHGGALALQFAADFPDSLSSLVLLCPAHPFSGREGGLVRFYLSRTGRAFAHLLPYLPDSLHLFAFHRMTGIRRRFSYDDLAPYLHTLRTPGTVDHLLALLGRWRADMEHLAGCLRKQRLATPALLLWGDRDMIVPISSADALTRNLQCWEMFTLPGVGHLPNEEAPRECAALIKTWLTWRDTHWKYAGSRLGTAKSVSF